MSAEDPNPPRLTARVVGGPREYDQPYLVEVRLLNTSDIVELFHATFHADGGSIPEPLQRASKAVYPRGDHVWTIPVLLDEQTQARLVVEARGEYTKSHRRIELTVPSESEVDSGEDGAARVQASQPAPPRFALLSDHPIDPDEDMFEHRVIAERMAGFLLDARAVTPFTIGIQGGWGVGKSSLMQLLRHAIEDRAEEHRGRVRVAWFNAWTAEGTNALTGLIRSVLDQLDPSVLRRILRRTRRSSWLATPFVVLASWIGLRALADDLWQRFRVDAAQRNRIRKEIQDAVAAWSDKNRPLDQRRMLVVFIDDLDRCSPENIVQVFEAIRLYLDAPGLTFVIGYDPAIVGDALAQSEHASSAELSRAYLEKIIQVDYVVPVPDPERSLDLARACAHASGIAHLLADEDLSLLVQRSERNPRRLKRFLNTFVLSHQIDGHSSRLRSDEHIKILLLRMYFPSLFRLILVESEQDMLGQLIELARLRAAVRAGSDMDREQVEWLCRITGLAAPVDGESAEDVLTRLEKNVPEGVIALSRDNGLFSLAWSLGAPHQRADLLRRTRERLPSLAPMGLSGPPDGGTKNDRVVVCSGCGSSGHLSDAFCPSCGAYLEWSAVSGRPDPS
ncbi:P-loop NTPase fold protein [Amycolatopsis sp. lyj-108]|uniref:P-loop NTPase fold protein n=1 Tax=Amycolatopsis sp. lyj-108 TaxID=2789286 RepID=UPI00397E587E